MAPRVVLWAAVAASAIFVAACASSRDGADPNPTPADAPPPSPLAEEGVLPSLDCPSGDWLSTRPAAWLRGVLDHAGLPLEGCTGSAYVTRLGPTDLYIWAFEPSGAVDGEPNYVRFGEVEGAVVRGSTHRAVWEAHGLAIWIEAGPTSDELPNFAALTPLVAASLEIPYPAAEEDEDAGSQRLAHDGIAITVPEGWDGYATRIGPDDQVTVIWVASRPFAEPFPRPEFPHETLRALSQDDVAVEIVAQPPQADSASRPLLALPITLADGYFLADAYEGQPAPHVSTQIIEARVAGRALYVQVYFGRNEPDDTMRALANQLLSSLTVAGAVPASEAREDGFVRSEDAEVGVSGLYPEGWHRARALTDIGAPREVLALATYPLRGGAKAGECAPDTARADMPSGGAFVWLLEYRPLRDELGVDLPISRFPPKPSRFEIRRSDLGENLSCFLGHGYSTTFRTAGRPFQLLVAFGGRPTDERLAEVEAILNSLRFEELPPPPPDPYAGWPLLVTNPGDSLRPPPGWAAAAAMFPPATTPRPRPLFFASNLPLFGLPDRLVPHVDRLPPDPSWAVANEFPPDAVLLWVAEEDKGGESDEFPAIDRDWPSEEDLRPAEVLTKPNPELRWLRAGGSFGGYRFSVLIGIGPEASRPDVELALKSAVSLAVSGCWRDVIDDCPDR